MKIYILIWLLLIHFNTFSQNADEIIGFWVNEKDDKTIEIYKNKDLYYGKLIWIKDSEKGKGSKRLDVKNPNNSLENRNLLGIDYLLSFAYYTDKNVWKEGSIYNFETGNTYVGKISINGEGNIELTGYYGILWFLGRTKVFKKKN